MEIEIGRGKTARRAYGFDDMAIVPSRRTRDPRDVDIHWEFTFRGRDYAFPLPVLASAMDGVVDPAFAVDDGQARRPGRPQPRGHPDPLRGRRRAARRDRLVRQGRGDRARCRRSTRSRSSPSSSRSASRRSRTAACSWPPRSRRRTSSATSSAALDGGLDILIIQGTVVSAEHVSSYDKPLDLNAFIRDLDIPVIVGGCCSYQGALHLMRTGAVGVLVGVGPGHACTSRRVLGIGVPQGTAIADAAAARMRHLDETGTYCHVIADGGMRTGGDLAKAIAVRRRRRHDRLAARDAPPRRPAAATTGAWRPSTPTCRAARACAPASKGTLEDILLGPAHENDGTLNLFGGLRTSMATCGYENLKTFQKAEVMVAPSLQTEGKVAAEGAGRRDGPLA